MDRPCRTCRFGQGTIKCSGCEGTWYCSEQCHKEHWFHILECDTRQDLTTADYLGIACLEDVLPTHEQTLIDYGFHRAFTEENQTYLFGVYQGLFKFGGVTPETVHGWRTKGVLISEIKKHIENIPPGYRGKYFPWFLQNQWVLDGKTPHQELDRETEKTLHKLVEPLTQLRTVQLQMQRQKANEHPSGSQPSDTELPEFVFQAIQSTVLTSVLSLVIFAHKRSLVSFYGSGPTSAWLVDLGTILATIVASTVQPRDISLGWNLLAAGLVLTLAPNAIHWIGVWASGCKVPVLGLATTYAAVLGPAVFLLTMAIVQMRGSNAGDIYIILRLARGGLAYVTATLLDKYFWSLTEVSDHAVVLICNTGLILTWLLVDVFNKQENDFLKAGWVYSGGSWLTSLSGINKIIATWPAEKVKCYHFCSLLLSGTHPTRKSELWITFGFCACRDTEDEMDLARRYRQLLKSYSFEVFYAAFASSRLYDLFLAQNLRPQVQRAHPHLRGVLALSPIRNWSVWDLKQFILRDSDEEDSESPPCPASPAMLDYGFFNCKTDEDINDLKAIYTMLFRETDMRPTDLHQACIEGKLNNFVTKWVEIARDDRKKYKRLLKNIHPL